MSEQYTLGSLDSRTLADMQQRLLDDLNRPDLSNIAVQYIQDSIRFYQRKPWFFNETDNTAVLGWAANTFYPQGTTIVVTISGTQYALVNLIAGLSDGSTPAFTNTIFTVPGNLVSPPTFVPGPGTTQDGQVLWATVAVWPGAGVVYTQLSTVPFQNQYKPPLDYVAPSLVEITWSGNLRVKLEPLSYQELRGYDVIRPTPPSSYPTWWAWFQEQIYLWPYPVGFYPLTLSYLTAPPLVQQMGDTNFWMTKAEALIRAEASYRINKVYLHDDVAAQHYHEVVMAEKAGLISQYIQHHRDQGIAPDQF